MCVKYQGFDKYLELVCRIRPQPVELQEFLGVATMLAAANEDIRGQTPTTSTGQTSDPQPNPRTKAQSNELMVSEQSRQNLTSTLVLTGSVTASSKSLSSSLLVSGAIATNFAFVLRLTMGGGPLLNWRPRLAVALVWALATYFCGALKLI